MAVDFRSERGFWVDADGAAVGTKTVNFHRLFADSTGDGFVDAMGVSPRVLMRLDTVT